MLQEEITALRYEWSEAIRLDMVKTWVRALREIVGVQFTGIAVTDMRFLVEMRGLRSMGGKCLHLEPIDQQANIAPELRRHRSEVEMQSPEMLELRDAWLFNRKDGIHKRR